MAGGRLAAGRAVAVADAHDERRRRHDRALRRAEHPLLPWNFRSRSAIEERYGPGAVPEPLDGRRLAVLLRRTASRSTTWSSGELGVGGADGNPFAGARTRGFPMAPMRTTGWGELRRRRSLAARLAPVSGARRDQLRAVRRARRLHVLRGSARTTSATRARRRPPISRSSPARRRPGCCGSRPARGCCTSRPTTRGSPVGVRFVRDGRTYSQPAKVVLVGTYVFENSRLLLLSTSKAHPGGLGNDRGQVGRNWMSHVFPAQRYGRFPGRRLNLFNGNGSQVTCIDDFNADNFDHAGEAFVGGGMITNTHELAPLMFARGTPHPPYIPRWGSAWKAWMKENAQSVGVRSTRSSTPCPTRTTGSTSTRSPRIRTGCRWSASPTASTPTSTRHARSSRAGRRSCCRRWAPRRSGTHPARTWRRATARAGRGWARTPTRPSSTAGASPTTRRTSACSARRCSPPSAAATRRSRVQAVAWRTAQRIVDDWGAIAGA